MAILHIVIGNNIQSAVEVTAEVLHRGGVAVFPTETVYGIGVASGDAKALARLRRLKQRDAGKPFQLLTADVGMARKMGAVFSARAMRLAGVFWPGPMTMVVPDGAGAGTLGIRVPDSPFVLALCRELGRPLVTSSANLAGFPPPASADAADVFGDEIDLLVDGGAIVGGQPSTVVRATEAGFEILREGGVGREAIEAAWNE